MPRWGSSSRRASSTLSRPSSEREDDRVGGQADRRVVVRRVLRAVDPLHAPTMSQRSTGSPVSASTTSIAIAGQARAASRMSVVGAGSPSPRRSRRRGTRPGRSRRSRRDRSRRTRRRGAAGSCGTPFLVGLGEAGGASGEARAGGRRAGRRRATPRRRSTAVKSRASGRPSISTVGARGLADEVDADAVLVAPDARGRRGRRRQAEDRARGGGAEPRARLPVLAAGDVAGRVDVRDDGAGAVVDGHAVAASGEPASQRVSGATPTPTSTTSAAIVRPSARTSSRPARRRPRAARRRPTTPSSTRTPSLRCRSANQPPSRGPSTCASGTSAASISVTSTPRPRAVAATSWPTKPAPTIASRAPGTSAARRRVGVGERAQDVHVRAAGEHRQPPRAGAGGDDQLVVAELARRPRA